MGKGLSITAFVLSLLFFIPFAPIVGLVLGIVAVVKAKKGDLKGLAIAAIAIGIISGIFNILFTIGLFLAFTPELAAGGLTNEQGELTLQVAGKIFPFKFVDESTGEPISDLNTGLALDESKTVGVLVVLDNLDRYPPHTVLLEGKGTVAEITGAAVAGNDEILVLINSLGKGYTLTLKLKQLPKDSGNKINDMELIKGLYGQGLKILRSKASTNVKNDLDKKYDLEETITLEEFAERIKKGAVIEYKYVGGFPPGGIPDAKSDETYTATISPQGASPFTCKLVGATDIGGTLSLAQNCVIDGTAPHAVETRVIVFKVEITDANGNSNIQDMTLTIHPPPVNLELDERIEATLGKKFEHNFCKPKPGMNCGEGSTTPTGGNPPYTFTVSGQPMGLIMSLNGDLKGTIPELATPGEYSTEVCVKDTKGASDCGRTIIDVKEGSDIYGEWTGTILAKISLTKNWGYRNEDDYWAKNRETYNVEIIEKADISFTLVESRSPLDDGKYKADGERAVGGNAEVTIKASGSCGGEITENFAPEFDYILWEDGKDYGDFSKPALTFYPRHDHLVRLDTDCASYSRFFHSHQPFSESVGVAFLESPFKLKLEDGAVYEYTFKNDRGELVESRIEIHKVK